MKVYSVNKIILLYIYCWKLCPVCPSPQPKTCKRSPRTWLWSRDPHNCSVGLLRPILAPAWAFRKLRHLAKQSIKTINHIRIKRLNESLKKKNANTIRYNILWRGWVFRVIRFRNSVYKIPYIYKIIYRDRREHSKRGHRSSTTTLVEMTARWVFLILLKTFSRV